MQQACTSWEDISKDAEIRTAKQGAEGRCGGQSRVQEAPDVAALRTLYQEWVESIQNRDPATSSLHTQR